MWHFLAYCGYAAARSPELQLPWEAQDSPITQDSPAQPSPTALNKRVSCCLRTTAHQEASFCHAAGPGQASYCEGLHITVQGFFQIQNYDVLRTPLHHAVGARLGLSFTLQEPLSLSMEASNRTPAQGFFLPQETTVASAQPPHLIFTTFLLTMLTRHAWPFAQQLVAM